MLQRSSKPTYVFKNNVTTYSTSYYKKSWTDGSLLHKTKMLANKTNIMNRKNYN